uniref:Uncharacterized protein n=1 Tax=Haptolina ericina TaxID=156174 RepID=A0A7S3FHY7_9EUKA|mmetsp:Transcript_69945/g.155883  ORF Transcript_69945/g.155883 Transcript_69945/m.155883 type:complete len:145 (+) Transcript_69945:260-694(+)
MLLSQRLIHTRVYGQFIAISATIAVMLFGESMKTDGFYVIGPDGRVARSNHVQTTKMRHWYSMSTDERKALDAEAATEGGDGSTGPNYDLLVPLLYAPLLPLMVVGLRGRVQKETLTKIVGGTIFVALAHAGSIMFTDKTITMQ